MLYKMHNNYFDINIPQNQTRKQTYLAKYLIILIISLSFISVQANTPDIQLIYQAPENSQVLTSLHISEQENFIIASGDFTDSVIKYWSLDTKEVSKNFIENSYKVNDLSISKDGKIIALACSDFKVRVQNQESGEIMAILEGQHLSSVEKVKFSENQKYLISLDKDNLVLVWDIQDLQNPGILMNLVDYGIDLKGVTISQDEKYLIINDGVYELENSMNKLYNIDVTETLGGQAIHPEGKSFVQSFQGQNIIFSELENYNKIAKLNGHIKNAFSIAFSPDGQFIATGGRDNLIKIWDGQDGSLKFTLRGHYSWVERVQFSPDSKYLLSTGLDNVIRIWDLEKEDTVLLKDFEQQTYFDNVDSLQFYNQGKSIIYYVVTSEGYAIESIDWWQFVQDQLQEKIDKQEQYSNRRQKTEDNTDLLPVIIVAVLLFLVAIGIVIGIVIYKRKKKARMIKKLKEAKKKRDGITKKRRFSRSKSYYSESKFITRGKLAQIDEDVDMEDFISEGEDDSPYIQKFHNKSIFDSPSTHKYASFIDESHNNLIKDDNNNINDDQSQLSFKSLDMISPLKNFNDTSLISEKQKGDFMEKLDPLTHEIGIIDDNEHQKNNSFIIEEEQEQEQQQQGKQQQQQDYVQVIIDDNDQDQISQEFDQDQKNSNKLKIFPVKQDSNVTLDIEQNPQQQQINHTQIINTTQKASSETLNLSKSKENLSIASSSQNNWDRLAESKRREFMMEEEEENYIFNNSFNSFKSFQKKRKQILGSIYNQEMKAQLKPKKNQGNQVFKKEVQNAIIKNMKPVVKKKRKIKKNNTKKM